MTREFLWYVPNTIQPGHRGDDTVDGWGTLDFTVEQAVLAEEHGWGGALIGTGWGRPDTFTVATAVAARTRSFTPLIAVRPGYWQPAHFASAAATLYQLAQGRVYVNIVSGLDDPDAYGDSEFDMSRRYDRTREFLHLVRKLWTEENVSYDGEFWKVKNSTAVPRLPKAATGGRPRLYFGGASAAAEEVAAAEADVQLFWGEPVDDIAERIQRLRTVSETVGRVHAPLEFGLRITTLIRDTSEEAWRDAEARVQDMARSAKPAVQRSHGGHGGATGQRRLEALAARGDVLDTNLYTAPGRVGGGGAGTTWLVGTAAEVADSLRRYADLGIDHFVLSDTPYKREVARIGTELLPLLREPAVA